jgi:hypothetical protein
MLPLKVLAINQIISRIVNNHLAVCVIIVLLGTVLLGIGAWIRPNLGQSVYDWQLFRQPERLSELFFTDHTKLPATYTPNTAYTLTFTVRNLEDKPVTYRYEILQQAENAADASLLRTGNFQLASGDSHTETVEINYADAGQRSRIIVRLPDQNQTIHYWVSR